MKKKVIIGALVTFSVVIIGLSFYFKNSSSSKDKSEKWDTIKIQGSGKVFINGVITPEQTEDIYLDPTKGNVDTVSVKNGQIVKKGDVLFKYKNEQVIEQVKEIDFQLKSSKSQKKDLLKQKENLKNQPSIAGQSMGSENGLSTESIDEQIKLYEEKIDSLKKKEYVTVEAPIAGKVVLNKEKATEEVKGGMKPYITIENNNFYVKGTTSEKDLTKLKKNQLVDITILPTNKNVKGKLDSIGNRPVVEAMAVGNGANMGNSDVSHYDVRINLDSQENLINGFHVQAVIKLSEKSVEIPKSAVLQDGKTSYVYKVENKKLSKRVITCSAVGSDKMAVSGGLKESEEIIKNPTSDMKEGISIE